MLFRTVLNGTVTKNISNSEHPRVIDYECQSSVSVFRTVFSGTITKNS